MERPATWKVITVGAAMTGLGIVGAGAAAAVTPAPLPGIGIVTGDAGAGALTGTVVAFDDDWTETYWDDQRQGDDWTETYWDD